MLNELEFVIYGDPPFKRRHRHRRLAKRPYNPEENRIEEEAIRLIAKKEIREYEEFYGEKWNTEGDYAMYLRAYFPIPKSRTKKWRKENAEGKHRHLSRLDADNVYKIVADALNGIVFTGDSRVSTIVAKKRYVNDPSGVTKPCVIIRIVCRECN